jgi:hypothetical protein
VNTIAIHLAVATTLTACHLSHVPAAAIRAAVQGAESMTALFLFVAIILIAVMACAAIVLAALLAELLRATLKVTYALVTVVTVIAALVAMILHH